MRVPVRGKSEGVGFNMTPMIDIVFLLIIFFLVSSHLARQEVQTPLDLPTARQGDDPKEDDARRVVINVLPEPDPRGRIMVSGRRMSADVAALTELIRESRRGEDPLEVRIRCDRRAPYRDVAPIMLACAEAKVWKVTFGVIEGR
jgi:biopolymer transport protein ExbD